MKARTAGVKFAGKPMTIRIAFRHLPASTELFVRHQPLHETLRNCVSIPVSFLIALSVREKSFPRFR